jgi:hypothetical protein
MKKAPDEPGLQGGRNALWRSNQLDVEGGATPTRSGRTHRSDRQPMARDRHVEMPICGLIARLSSTRSTAERPSPRWRAKRKHAATCRLYTARGAGCVISATPRTFLNAAYPKQCVPSLL